MTGICYNELGKSEFAEETNMERNCFSCRYGNNCPYGGAEIFCMKDYKFNSILELCSLFDDIKIRDKIFKECKRDKNSSCKDYQPVNRDEFFTYSDFGH